VCCIPLTAVVVLLPLETDTAMICCFHEACVSFASVATAATVLAITADRYDISVRPANRVLTMGRALVLLGSIWALSFVSFLVPFMEVSFFINSESDQNQTLATAAHPNEYYTEQGLYYHLLAQIPIFFFTAVVMLVTYYKILQALNIRIGARFPRNLPRQKRKSDNAVSLSAATQAESTDASQSGAGVRAPLGMRASVSVIIALRRAVKRHRERRERQKRVFRMSLLIISTFLLCWTPITVLNTVILSTSLHSDVTVRLRLGFLVMAYGTTVFHPLLYAFTRQKFQKVLKSKMKKRVLSVADANPTPNKAVVHNSWIDPRRHKKVAFEDADAREKCLCLQEVE